MMANKQQWCGIAGWTARRFDAAIVKGFPAHKKTSSRGDVWQVDTRDGIQWIVEQEAPKVRPKPRQADRGEPPKGWEAFAAVEEVEDPVLAAAMVSVLALMYALPRLVANVAADEGIGIGKTHRISVGTLMIVLEYCRTHFEFWPKGDDDVRLIEAAFEQPNWPALAAQAGEPSWEPPVYGLGWAPVTPEEREECVRHGEAVEAKYRRLQEQDAAARADA
jgi:hypothetical protein